mmetsp:Transcript_5104/g.11309  ORF Transcript_5104/g.11309 Transcript_5104/m.11309 type:complete len:301 (-) Transcript_5104:645-1547(-)
MPKSSFAAPSEAISSLYSSCSFFLVSVLSATDLSRALIPSARAFKSWVKVAMSSLVSSMEAPRSLRFCSKALILSSVVSNWPSQYSFLCESSACSCASTAMSSSINVNTFSKLTLRPDKAMVMSSKAPLLPFCARMARLFSIAAALRVCAWLSETVCSRLGLGRVFLKSSNASSSLRILMVSEMATNSSLRVLVASSHSAVLVSQFLLRSARNFWFSANASEVSSMSLPMLTISTPSSPMRVVLPSMALVAAAISFSLAATSSPYAFLASSSCLEMSAKSPIMSSFICFRMPVISPLAGA